MHCVSACALLLSVQLHLIAANEPFSGSMRGVSGADYVCYREARDAGLAGTFRAFLTSRVQNLDSIVHREEDRRVPICNARVSGRHSRGCNANHVELMQMR